MIAKALDQLYQHLPTLFFYLFLYKIEDYNFARMTQSMHTLFEKFTLYLVLLSFILIMNISLFCIFGTVTPGQ